VDKDGTGSYSKIVAVNIQPYAGVMIAYPNPVKNEMLVMYNLQNSKQAELRVIDISGKTVLRQQLTVAQNQSSLNLSALPAGTYFVQLITDKGVQHVQFIKQP
jgi:hypothetical protein